MPKMVMLAWDGVVLVDNKNWLNKKIMKKVGCPVIDVSNKAIEETAGIIFDIMKENGLNIYKEHDKNNYHQ